MCQSAMRLDREEREQPGSAGEHEQTDDQQALALVAVRERARRDAEQEHRRHAQERHERHQEGRAAHLQHVDADRQQLEPAQHAGDAAGQPDAQERRVGEQRGSRGCAAPAAVIGHGSSINLERALQSRPWAQK